jgi:outer membrane protein assembly factor BamB
VIAGSCYNFGAPSAEVVAGSHLFVANGGYNSIDELDTATGALVRIIAGSSYQFNGIDAMAVGGDDLFVVNGVGDDATGDGGSVTEIDAATGAFVRVISDPSISIPDAVAVDGGDVFVANPGDGLTASSVTEIDASTGSCPSTGVDAFEEPLAEA